MSATLWCDQGNHAFSAKDPDSQSFTRKIKETSERGYVIEKQEDFDICGPCLKKTQGTPAIT